jgi:hypothetical protein
MEMVGWRLAFVGKAIFSRMIDADAAPFRNLQPDPWIKVRELIEAA